MTGILSEMKPLMRRVLEYTGDDEFLKMLIELEGGDGKAAEATAPDDSEG